MKRHRVVVTGVGIVSPIGSDFASFAHHLLTGVSGAGPITIFDPAELPTRIAAQVDMQPDAIGFRDRKVGFALRAAEQAMGDACAPGTAPGLEEGGANAAASLAIGLELFAMPDLVAARRPGFELPTEATARMTFLQTPSDLCMHLIARRHGLRQPPLTFISACAAGTDAIGTAARLVATGSRRWMLAGGTDSMINPLGVGGFCKIMATSTRNEEPQRAARPFDRGRDGFVLGEGAAMLILERREDALARGARIYGEVAGYGRSMDADNISRPHPEGRGAVAAMQAALDDAGLVPHDVDWISAHGTSTPLNDPLETLAIKRLFGERAAHIPVAAPKSMFGHLIAAAGAVEAVAVLACMADGRVHPTINLYEADPACDLDYVPHTARRHPQGVVLSNSFGFGGVNAVIALRHTEAS